MGQANRVHHQSSGDYVAARQYALAILGELPRQDVDSILADVLLAMHYSPLAGRWREYDGCDLTAIDCAVAVEPAARHLLPGVEQ